MSSSNYYNLHSGQGKLLGWVIQLANIYRFCNCIWLPDFFILGKLSIFTDRAVFLKGRPRKVYISVFGSPQFVLFGPALLQNFPRDSNTFFSSILWHALRRSQAICFLSVCWQRVKHTCHECTWAGNISWE